MATFKRFEDIEAWQLANQLSKEIFGIIKNTDLSSDYALRTQIDKSTMSVSDNIAEGFERNGTKEFIQFLSIAKASCGEVRSQLYKLKDREYINDNQFSELKEKSEIISKKIGSLITYLKNSENKGYKFEEPEEEYKKSSTFNPETISGQALQPSTFNLQPSTSFFAHSTTVIDEGCEIGEGTKIWHFSHIMPNCKIGKRCNLGQNVVVSPGVILGENVKVQNNVSIYTGVICEDDVFLGPSMVFTNVINPRSAIVRKDEYKQTLVKKGASIGANATVICGNTIGEYALVGAGAVITKDVPAYALLVGNPAKQIGWVSEYGHRLQFENNLATCPESGEKYKLDKNTITKL
jgi:UDP-2-acetamido-3-amino-2,3-dideoxy-glucuronate N-acetyltransferase